MTTLVCSKCHKEKDVSEFNKGSKKNGYSSQCKSCRQEYYKEHPRELISVTCSDCGEVKEIQKVGYEKTKRPYRCNLCSSKFYGKLRPTNRVILTCDKCGKEKEYLVSQKPKYQYRCVECTNEFGRTKTNKITIPCSVCGKEKMANPSYFEDKNPYLCKRCMIIKRYDDPNYAQKSSDNMKTWHENHPGATKGENNGRWGVKETEEQKKQKSERVLKLYENEEYRDKITKANRIAALNLIKRMKKSANAQGIPLEEWTHFMSPLNYLIRNCDKMEQWRFAVFKRDRRRDWFSGVACGKNAEAHHIIPFNKLLKRYKITTLEEALKCDALWDINNGVTMLKTSHDAYHV